MDKSERPKFPLAGQCLSVLPSVMVLPDRGSIYNGRMKSQPDFDTSYSLLEQLCHEPQEASWERLVKLFPPQLRSWTLRDDRR